ncbi:unnamed protein product [Linum tenue]|uniref:Uncharacterized protein n=1 Tax=Linum tenue TaxID=586396 RepID=A0AAV0MRM9_9ROSI|nr:unnamed protein product [Linum tenue]
MHPRVLVRGGGSTGIRNHVQLGNCRQWTIWRATHIWVHRLTFDGIGGGHSTKCSYGTGLYWGTLGPTHSRRCRWSDTNVPFFTTMVSFSEYDINS